MKQTSHTEHVCADRLRLLENRTLWANRLILEAPFFKLFMISTPFQTNQPNTVPKTLSFVFFPMNWGHAGKGVIGCFMSLIRCDYIFLPCSTFNHHTLSRGIKTRARVLEQKNKTLSQRVIKFNKKGFSSDVLKNLSGFQERFLSWVKKTYTRRTRSYSESFRRRF